MKFTNVHATTLIAFLSVCVLLQLTFHPTIQQQRTSPLILTHNDTAGTKTEPSVAAVKESAREFLLREFDDDEPNTKDTTEVRPLAVPHAGPPKEAMKMARELRLMVHGDLRRHRPPRAGNILEAVHDVKNWNTETGRKLAHDRWIHLPDRKKLPAHHRQRPVPVLPLSCPRTYNKSLERIMRAKTVNLTLNDIMTRRWAEYYTEAFEETDASRRNHKLLGWRPSEDDIMRMVQPMDLKTGDIVADIGCGTGHFLEVVLQYLQLQVVAIDALDVFVSIARERLKPGFFCQAAATNLSFIPDNTVHHVVSNLLLNQMTAAEAINATGEFLRIVRNNGTVFLGLLNHENQACGTMK